MQSAPMNLCSFPTYLHLRPRQILLSLALFIFCAVAGAELRGQSSEVRFIDHTYVDNIKSVRLHISGFPHSYPLIELGGNARLRLSFDDLQDEIVRYSYKFIHCDQNWTPSGLSELEYNSGFTVDYLDEYDFSIRTLKNYVHYDLVFPNENMKLDASGNYLLVVYNSEDDEFPVITRRFMVQENIAGVSGRVMRPADVSRIRTHQEVDLNVNTKQMNLRAPMQELSATIIQNNRWDNAIIGISPNMLQREAVDFNYQGKVLFRGLNEYRNLDIRSIRAPRTPMVSITNEGTAYGMMMEPDQSRGGGAHYNYYDLNGDFVNVRDDAPQVNIADEFVQRNLERFQVDYNGEYIEMTFVLDTPDRLNGDVYVFGGMTEYQLKPEFKMVYNQTTGMYVARALLKQGFYNYHYVLVDGKGKPRSRPADVLNYEVLEGTFDNTENDYLALIYWRPFGGRYDRLVGSVVLNSNFN